MKRVIQITTSSGATWLCNFPCDLEDWIVAAQVVEVPDNEPIEYEVIQAP